MKQLYDVIIIGAGSAGLCAGIYAGRSKLKTLILHDHDVGGQIRITSEVVNYPGILKTDGSKLSDTMKKQAEQFGVQFQNATIASLSFDQDIKEVTTTDGMTYRGISVILATGAKPRTLGFVGESEFTGHGVAYCATCDGEFFTGLPIFVIGAGFAAAEEALFLTRFAKKVTIIAREPAFTCSKTIADKVLAHPKIEVKFNTELLSISGDVLPKNATFKNNITNETWDYRSAPEEDGFGVFVFVGYYPLTDLYKGIIDLDDAGYVLANEDMETSIDGIYAAGDLRVKRLRQLVTAVSDGAIAATSVEKYVEEKKEALGIVVEQTPTTSTEGSETSFPDDFFDDDLKTQLMPILDQMKNKISLCVVFDEENALTKELMKFAQDFAEMGEKITYHQVQKSDLPSFAQLPKSDLYPYVAIMKQDDQFSGIAYHAVPGGHEFNSFVLAIYQASGAGQPLDLQLKQQIHQISDPIELKICISLSCTLCPDVVTAAQTLALHNPHIQANIIDLAHFPDLKSKFHIMSVPAIIINNEKLVFGKKSIEELITILVDFNNVDQQ